MGLSPAPWFVNPRTGVICHGDPSDDRDNYPIDNPEDDEFTCLARNAYDVMMRRGWGVGFLPASDESPNEFIVLFHKAMPLEMPPFITDDPFTCLIEADKWATANNL
jgi:hypothetical protein